MTRLAKYDDLKAVFINCTLKKSPEVSHTERLMTASMKILEKQGVNTKLVRSIDHAIATGVYPNMTEHGWKEDDWPEIYKMVCEADILVLGGPIWLGDNSSEMKKIIERLYAHSAEPNNKGQAGFYGKVGGCIITGNEDGAKHCSMNVLYSLNHVGFSIPPAADSDWLGEAGPGPSYGDELEDGKKAGYDNDFTNRNTTFMSWNLLHLARILKDAGGFPAYGNISQAWQDGERFDFKLPE